MGGKWAMNRKSSRYSSTEIRWKNGLSDAFDGLAKADF